MKKIAPFTLKEPDICVKCGNDMPVGTEATWLREPERKGYYHPACEAKPTIEALTRIKVVAADSPLGYCWMRQREIPTDARLGETTPATRLVPSHNPTPKPVAVEPTSQIGPDGILIDTLAKLLLPKLTEAFNNHPRIVVNVYVPKAGDEVKALDLLSKELFLLDKVQSI